ncbi:hypothetical protein L596_012931 [Steinernema carpocapsae]|uniref:Uncharacterized protein n=1 Tax=Steinernema carpocapsae TaxID=34508 RepID=A0A4U5NZG3_STECR|nr:hypothetical protein L596_012931 [Steinernema carpocapsae]
MLQINKNLPVLALSPKPNPNTIIVSNSSSRASFDGSFPDSPGDVNLAAAISIIRNCLFVFDASIRVEWIADPSGWRGSILGGGG